MKEILFKGFYTYEDANFISGERLVAFRMRVTDHQGSFSGYAQDDETSAFFGEGEIRVKGFVENDFISFVKTYPQAYQTNTFNNYEAEPIPGSKPHNVEYFGNWVPEEMRFIGKYQVVSDPVVCFGTCGPDRVDFYEGNWEMTFETEEIAV